MSKFFKKLWANFVEIVSPDTDAGPGPGPSTTNNTAETEDVSSPSTLKEIPICGNAFTTAHDTSNHCHCRGFENWASPQTVWTIFFRLSEPDRIGVTLRLRVQKRCQSSFRFSWDDQPLLCPCNSNEIHIPDAMGGEFQNIWIGHRDVVHSGYVRLNLQGINRTGNTFADVSHLLVSHTIETNDVIFNVSEEAYFGRRGPSVHLRYPVPGGSQRQIEYYYNEVTIPANSDAVGLYAMACGFSGGYFGMQVNGPSERRVLFSIWSECNTDNPCDIPEDYRVQLLKKGPDVHVGTFGNEGSGGQSFLRFNWVAGNTYKFLLHSKPLDSENSLYTAWFKRFDLAEWELIASFRKPKVSKYLSDFHSFLENFEPGEGHCERVAHFGNQWARDSDGEWLECLEAHFTGDATSKAGRRDFAGGCCASASVNTNAQDGDGGNVFYLRHCGFFDEMVPTGQCFYRVPTGRIPDVDFESLPY